MRAPGALLSPALALAVVLGATAACDRAPSATGMREWTPQDHDGEQRGPGAKQGARGTADAGGRGDGGAAPPGDELLVELTWQKQCAACHGSGGRGDGPQGPMVKAKDLTSADWQGKVDDGQIASAIRNGKGTMPKFDKLPDEVVAGLVKRIRSLRSR